MTTHGGRETGYKGKGAVASLGILLKVLLAAPAWGADGRNADGSNTEQRRVAGEPDWDICCVTASRFFTNIVFLLFSSIFLFYLSSFFSFFHLSHLSSIFLFSLVTGHSD